jgi:YidC/Oxa1 family membrane protein insertase
LVIWNDLLKAFGSVLESLHHATGSYGLAIIIITVAIRVVVWPLTQAQVTSMRRMQQLQPELKRLQDRYKNDKERLNQETMRLWRENRVNPAAGCLPMVVQLPFLWAIYDVLEHYQYHGVTSFLWLPNLTHPDPVFLIPVLGGLTTFWQTKISMVATPGQSASQQMMMTYLMPVFIAYIFWRLPAGVGLYWVVSNFFGIAQQYAANRRIPALAVGAAAPAGDAGAAAGDGSAPAGGARAGGQAAPATGQQAADPGAAGAGGAPPGGGRQAPARSARPRGRRRGGRG